MNAINSLRDSLRELGRKRDLYARASVRIADVLSDLEAEIEKESADMIDNSRLATLSIREREVFGLIAKDMKPVDIAKKLGRSQKTIEAQRETIKKKLGFDSVYELRRAAQKKI